VAAGDKKAVSMIADGNPGMSRSAAVFFLACFLLVCFSMYLIFQSFFTIFVWACVLTVVFQPLYRWGLRKFGDRRLLASAVICALILVLIVLPVMILAIMIGQQSMALYHSIQSNTSDMGTAAAKLHELQSQPSVQRFSEQLGRLFGPKATDLEQLIRGSLERISALTVAYAPSLIVGVGDLIYKFFMIFITMFFLFVDGPKALQLIRESNPLPTEYQAEFMQIFENVSSATFFGSILGAILNGVISALLFWAFGIQSPLFWGALASFVSLIPVVGSLLIIVPFPAYLILCGYTGKGIFLLVLTGISVFGIENVLKPMIMSGRSHMHPLLIFFSVLGGLKVFGFLGILLGPLLVTVFLTFLDFYREQFQANRAAKSNHKDTKAQRN
jgi:predicted PurR-regulated permease PerM